jgi:septal ring factor EnvC (AmiA/AmiB activator)
VERYDAGTEGADHRYELVNYSIASHKDGNGKEIFTVKGDGVVMALFDTFAEANKFVAEDEGGKLVGKISRSLRAKKKTPKEVLEAQIKVLEATRDRLADQVDFEQNYLEILKEQIQEAETKLAALRGELPQEIRTGRRILEL